MAGHNSRARIAQLLAKFLGSIEDPESPLTIDRLSQDRALSPFENELLYGVIRRYYSLCAIRDRYLRKPLKKSDLDVSALMLVGTYELYHHPKRPAYATVNETVEACQALGKPWAKGLMNAILQRTAKAAAEATSSGKEHPTILEQTFGLLYDHPEWLAQAILEQYGTLGEGILQANNERAPMALRLHPNIDSSSFIKELESNDHSAEDWAELPGAIILGQPTRANELPGFAQGSFAVQDAGAQWASTLLPLAAGDRALDVGSAPGGKLLAHAARYSDASFVALEKVSSRAEVLHQEATRLALQDRFELHIADARDTQSWWDGKTFDAVLIDAPCSGTGTLRRHPDIKLRLKPKAIPDHQKLQLELLSALWPLLKPGGSLLYCTCSILAAENDQVIEKFLATHADAVTQTFQLPVGLATEHGWQLLPTEPRTDGFYYARLARQ